MNNPVALVNYATLKNNKLKLYTETKHDFIVGDYIYISGGYYDNTENLLQNIINYSISPTFNNIFKKPKGYKIIEVSSNGYEFVLNDFEFNNLNHIVYPYGNTTYTYDDYNNYGLDPNNDPTNNRLGRLDDNTLIDGYCSISDNTVYNKIYVHKSAILSGAIKNTKTDNIIIGTRITNNDSTVKTNSCITPQSINNSIIINSNIKYSDILSYSSKISLFNIIDENTQINGNLFNKIGLVTDNKYYTYTSKIQKANIVGSNINNCDLYDSLSNTQIDNCNFNNSIIGRQYFSNSNNLITVNDNLVKSEFNNCDIFSCRFLNATIETKINNSNFENLISFENINIINFQNVSGKGQIEIEIKTNDIFKYDLAISDEYYFGFCSKKYSSLYGFSNIVKTNTIDEPLPIKCKIINFTKDQNSINSYITFEFDIQFDSTNINDYIFQSDYNLILYYTETHNINKKLNIIDSNINTCMLTNNNNLINSSTIIGGRYNYVTLENFKSNALNTNFVYLLENNIYSVMEGTTKSLNETQLYNTYMKSKSILYSNSIKDSYVYSNTGYNCGIIGATIEDSIIENSFLYHCNIINSKTKNIMWDMCSIQSNETDTFYYENNINIGESVLHTKNYINNRTTTLPYQNFVLLNGVKTDLNKKSRNIEITKTSDSLIHNNVNNVKDGDINSIYEAGEYNSAIYNNNNITKIDLPIIRADIYREVPTPPDYNFISSDLNFLNGYPSYPISITSIAISSKSLDFRNNNKILVLNTIREEDSNINTKYLPYYNKTTNTTYTPNSTYLLGYNPPLRDFFTNELQDYKVDTSFIESNPTCLYPILNDVKLYSFNLINAPITYNGNISNLAAVDVIDVNNIPTLDNIIDKITFNGANLSVSTTTKTDITPDRICLGTIDINNGFNNIKISFNNSNYVGINGTYTVACSSLLYEVERIYIYNNTVNNLIGDTFVLRNALNDRYVLDDILITDILTLPTDIELKYDNGISFEYDFILNNTYFVYFDVWITTHYVNTGDLNVDNRSFYNTSGLGNGYNNDEKTSINGSSRFKIRIYMTVNSNQEIFYLLDNDGDFIYTNDNKKIIIN